MKTVEDLKNLIRSSDSEMRLFPRSVESANCIVFDLQRRGEILAVLVEYELSDPPQIPIRLDLEDPDHYVFWYDDPQKVPMSIL